MNTSALSRQFQVDESSSDESGDKNLDFLATLAAFLTYTNNYQTQQRRATNICVSESTLKSLDHKRKLKSHSSDLIYCVTMFTEGE